MRYLFGVLLYLSLFSSIALADPATNNAALSDPSRPLVLVKPGVIVLRLASNPTTGFRWFYSSKQSSSWIQPVSANFYSSNDRLIGGGGQMVWTFKVNASVFSVPQLGNISLIYRRPWDEDGKRIARFQVVVSPKSIER